MKKTIGLIEVKKALNDGRFRDSLPAALGDDIAKWLGNKSCPCNMPLYRKILLECQDQLKAYFPDSEIRESKTDMVVENNFIVINCHIDKIQDELRLLGPGRKQIAIARFEDQATLIINELAY